VSAVAEVLLEREGPIVWLRMNRPEAHNAFSKQMTALMADRVDELARDRDARVAISCGNGPSFSTRVDVKELAVGEMDVEGFVAWNRMARRLRELEIPLIGTSRESKPGSALLLAESTRRCLSPSPRALIVVHATTCARAMCSPKEGARPSSRSAQ
jgi:hypothetical protein